jgi:2'-5' RNA ligase
VADTALICRVPEAERYIARYRERYDPSARRNVPAHVTVLYPFLQLHEVDAGVLAQLGQIAAGVRCFDFSLSETRRFPVSLYLWPKPDTGFSALTDAVWRAYPDHPPFAGKFPTVVPHVTVAHGDEPTLCEIEVELRIAMASGGMVRGHCSELVLIENSSGRWEEVRCFPLGAS